MSFADYMLVKLPESCFWEAYKPAMTVDLSSYRCATIEEAALL